MLSGSPSGFSKLRPGVGVMQQVREKGDALLGAIAVYGRCARERIEGIRASANSRRLQQSCSEVSYSCRE